MFNFIVLKVLSLSACYFCFVACECKCQKPCPPIPKCPCPEKCIQPKRLVMQVGKKPIQSKKERESQTSVATITHSTRSQTICNSERLRKILIKTMIDDSITTKRIIQLMAERSFNEPYNVICAHGDFSYITNTDEYCQEIVKGRTCYIFKRNTKTPKMNRMINFSK